MKIIFDILEKNIRINKCLNIHPFKKAVYNEDNLTLYFLPPDLSKDSRFYGAPYSGNALTSTESGIPVKTITIDSLNISLPISFIKVDIQGADLFAMQGAKETILKYKPAIIFEFEQPIQDEFKTSFNDYVEFVKSINYKFAEIILGMNYLIVPND